MLARTFYHCSGSHYGLQEVSEHIEQLRSERVLHYAPELHRRLAALVSAVLECSEGEELTELHERANPTLCEAMH